MSALSNDSPNSGYALRVLVLVAIVAGMVAAANVYDVEEAGFAGRTAYTKLVVQHSAADSLIDFGTAEALFAQLETSREGKFVLNEGLANALAVAVLPLELDRKGESLSRLQRLLRDSFPGEGGAQLATLVERFHRYKHIEQQRLTRIAGADVSADEKRFAAQMQTQTEYFDEATRIQLFGAQNALQEYMLKLRALESRSELDEEEQALERDRLQREYETQVLMQP